MEAAYEQVPTRSGTSLAPARIVGGVGGLVFVSSVVAQNLLRTSLPTNDASIGKITAFYAGHRTETAVLTVLFAIGAVGLATFTGAVLTRLRATVARGPAIGGALGVAGVIALFATTVVTDLALSGYVHRGHPDPGVVGALWILHASAFGILTIFLGIALAGLAAGAAADGLVPAVWKGIGLIGGLLLLAGGAATPAAIDGSKVALVSLVGFLVWLVFVGLVSVALLRESPQPSLASSNS